MKDEPSSDLLAETVLQFVPSTQPGLTPAQIRENLNFHFKSEETAAVINGRLKTLLSSERVVKAEDGTYTRL